MLCPVCNRSQAAVKVSKICGNETVIGHVCYDCRQKAESADVASFYNTFVTGYKKTCPRCGWTYKKFSETLLLGCPHCYKTFSKEVFALVEGIQKK